MKVFRQHGSIGLLTVKEMLFQGGEPTLFEVALIEIMAALEAHTENIIMQGRKIKAQGEILEIVDRLELALKMLNARLNEADKTLEGVKKLMTDQIAELRKIMEEME